MFENEIEIEDDLKVMQRGKQASDVIVFGFLSVVIIYERLVITMNQHFPARPLRAERGHAVNDRETFQKDHRKSGVAPGPKPTGETGTSTNRCRIRSPGP